MLLPLFHRVFVATAALAILASPAPAEPRQQVEDLLAQMTLEEKIGQLNFVSILPAVEPGYDDIAQRIAEGGIGGLFNIHGTEETRVVQEIAVTRSRLKIPLLLALDVLHGYRTIFPTPLAQAATWDMAAIERAERIAAAEATAGGVNLMLAPMLDVSRDPRWGRVVEGPGESPWLAARIAAARVRGIQGEDLRRHDAAAACAKHFGANGAVEGGRDYTAGDVSERALRETWLPSFEAAVAAGVGCVMAAFNAPDGVPTVASRRLLDDVLRGEWGFDGLVTSDFEAIQELTGHGVAADLADAARRALFAGTDVDMQSKAYAETLPDLVRAGAVGMAAVDQATRRVLALKERLGLFEDPYRGSDAGREAGVLGAPEHRAAAQEMAEKSFVLLKNEGDILPFKPDVRRVALVGPLGDSAVDTLGPWAARGEPSETVTLKDGLKRRLGADVVVDVARGGAVDASSAEEIAAAVETARRSDVVILAVGERFNQSGEGASRSELGLLGGQEALAQAVLALGKPTAMVVFAGRPLALAALTERASAVLYAWQPGTMGGAALARTLMGDVAPYGRLPVSVPRSVGQIPVHHEQRPTGRPPTDPPEPYTAGYADGPHTPLHPFGFGLTYTSFQFGPPKLDRATLRPGERATVTVAVRNTGRRSGEAVVQLYVRPKVAEVSLPLKTLRGFVRAALEPGETRTVALPLTDADLAYWRTAQEFGATPGPVEIMTGPNAGTVQSVTLDYRP